MGIHQQLQGGWPIRGVEGRLPAPREVDYGDALDVAPPINGRRPTALQERDLARVADAVRRRWRTGLLIFLVVVIGVSTGSLMRAPVYRATGLLEIRQSAGAVPVETLFSTDGISDDDLETQFGILKSAKLAERVIANLGPDERVLPDVPEHASLAPRAVDADTKAAQLSPEALRNGLIVNPHRGSRLVEVSFDSQDPELAARVVNSVFDNYLRLRMEEAQRSAEWLKTQLQEAQETLEDTEHKLHAYVRRHGLAVLETGEGELAREVNERLRSLNESLAGARAERFEKQSAYELAPRALFSKDVTGPVAESLSVRLADLRRERAKLATVFHDEYPAVKALNSQIAELERALHAESANAVSRAQREYRTAVRREALLRQALDQQKATAQALAQHSTGYQSLRREMVTSQQLFTMLDQKLKEVSISAALKASDVGIVDRPTPPESPRGPSLWLNIGLATMVGLLLAGGGIAVGEYLDTTVRTVEDVDSYLGVPTLAAIPAVAAEPGYLPPGRPAGPRGPWRRIDREGAHASPLGEAFAALRTAVLLDADAPPPRVLLITSARSAEGKTTVSINLALSLARLQHRVLLIDGNMRYPCVQDAFGLEDEPGLVGYLTTEVFWRAFVRTQAQPDLDVLVCGKPGASPADLLSLPRMQQLVTAASREYDFVIIDSPALLAHPADVRSLATLVDSVLLTVRQGSTSREAVSVALSQLRNVRGIVLNRSDSRDIPAHYRDASAAIPA